jgi:hypothetical protein
MSSDITPPPPACWRSATAARVWPASGLSLADCVFSGCRAGRSAATAPPAPAAPASAAPVVTPGSG